MREQGALLIPPSTCSCFFFNSRTCGGKPLLTCPPQAPLSSCFDCRSFPADVASPPGYVGVSTQAVLHSHTCTPRLVLVLICSLIIGGPRDPGLLMMCYFCSRPATGVSLSLLTEMGQSSEPAVIQTQSQAFWLPACRPSMPSPSSSSSAFALLEPAAKRSRQRIAGDDPHTCRLAVTAMTKLAPLLTSGCVKCRVVLHYVQEADALSPGSKPTPVVLHCGRVSVDIQSVFQKSLLKNPQIKTGTKSQQNSQFKTLRITQEYSLFLFLFFLR